jgi:hypothetical protein
VSESAHPLQEHTAQKSIPAVRVLKLCAKDNRLAQAHWQVFGKKIRTDFVLLAQDPQVILDDLEVRAFKRDAQILFGKSEVEQARNELESRVPRITAFVCRLTCKPSMPPSVHDCTIERNKGRITVSHALRAFTLVENPPACQAFFACPEEGFFVIW